MTEMSVELNGRRKIIKDEKGLYNVVSSNDSGLLAYIGIFDRIETDQGVFALARDQDLLALESIKYIDHYSSEPREIKMDQIGRMFFKPSLVDQREGDDFLFGILGYIVMGLNRFRRVFCLN